MYVLGRLWAHVKWLRRIISKEIFNIRNNIYKVYKELISLSSTTFLKELGRNVGLKRCILIEIFTKKLSLENLF